MHPTAGRLLLATLLAGVAPLAAFGAADQSSPKAAYKSYQQALATGDMETLKSCVVADEKRIALLSGQVAYTAAERRFRGAAIKAFPVAEKQLPDTSAALIAAIDKADVTIQGERALLRTNAEDTAVELQRAEGKWKLDLNTLYNDEDVGNIKKFREAVASIMDAMLPDIEAGKFTTYEQVTQTLQSRVLMRAALPQDDPATQPAAAAGK
jgi:hypothetical protein